MLGIMKVNEKEESKKEKSPYKKNELNVFTYCYYGNFFQNIPQFFRNIKYAWQRATRGYCDVDIWNLCDFYTSLIRDSIYELSETSHVYPGNDTPEGKSYSAWIKHLKKIALLMDKSVQSDIETDKYYPNKYETEFNALINTPDLMKREELPDGSVRVTFDPSPKENKIWRKYWDEAVRISKKKEKDRNTALDMLKANWNHLCD